MTVIQQQKLTAIKLQRCQAWLCEILLTKQISRIDGLQEPGKYWLYESDDLGFDRLQFHLLRQVEISKVSKLKVGDSYRKSIEGWVIPNELVSDFRDCIEVSQQHVALRREAIDLASKLPRNGFERIRSLSPEKMQALIDIFSDS